MKTVRVVAGLSSQKTRYSQRSEDMVSLKVVGNSLVGKSKKAKLHKKLY